MKAGDLVIITKEYGKYFWNGVDISGATAIVLKSNIREARIMISSGKVLSIAEPHAWIEVIDERR